MAEGEGAPPPVETEKAMTFSYPLIKHTDMNEEMAQEATELVVTACEKHSQNNEQAARFIKDSMDKKFGATWHVVVGEGFGFEVSYQCNNILYLFVGGTLAAAVWKC